MARSKLVLYSEPEALIQVKPLHGKELESFFSCHLSLVLLIKVLFTKKDWSVAIITARITDSCPVISEELMTNACKV